MRPARSGASGETLKGAAVKGGQAFCRLGKWALALACSAALGGCALGPAGFVRAGAQGSEGEGNAGLYGKAAAKVDAYFVENFGDELPLRLVDGENEAFADSALFGQKIVVSSMFEKGSTHGYLAAEMMRIRWFKEKRAARDTARQDEADVALFVILHELAHHDQTARDPFGRFKRSLAWQGFRMREGVELGDDRIEKLLLVNQREAYADVMALGLFAAMERDEARFARLREAVTEFRSSRVEALCDSGRRLCADYAHWTSKSAEKIEYGEALALTYAQLTKRAGELAKLSPMGLAKALSEPGSDVSWLEKELDGFGNDCSSSLSWFAAPLRACSSDKPLGRAAVRR